MDVTRTEDKNGAVSFIVSGYTTDVPVNTMLEFRIGDRVFNGGMVDSENHYQRALPDMEFDSVEVWTASKTDARMIDSYRVAAAETEEEDDQPDEKPAKAAKKKPAARKKAR